MKTYLGSNYSAREVFNITGTLPAEVIEAMVDHAEDVEAMRATIPNIEEGRNCFPSEDFIDASGVIADLRQIAGRLRGDNKAAILAVIEKLEALQTEMSGQSEYGRSEIDSALNVLEGY
jgi:hypothetical protein